MKTLVLGALVAGLTTGLAGCTTSYGVDVRNKSDEPVVVGVFRARAQDQNIQISRMERIGPGDRAGVATAAVPQEWIVFLEADTAGNPGWPARIDLRPGRTVVEVTKEGGRVRVVEVPRP